MLTGIGRLLDIARGRSRNSLSSHRGSSSPAMRSRLDMSGPKSGRGCYDNTVGLRTGFARHGRRARRRARRRLRALPRGRGGAARVGPEGVAPLARLQRAALRVATAAVDLIDTAWQWLVEETAHLLTRERPTLLPTKLVLHSFGAGRAAKPRTQLHTPNSRHGAAIQGQLG